MSKGNRESMEKDRKMTFWSRFWLRFDRSFAGGQGKQIVWLAAFVLSVMVVVWLLLIVSKYDTSFSFSENIGNTLNKVISYFFDSDALHEDVDSGTVRLHPVWAVVLSMIGMVLMGGALVSVIVNILERRVERVNNGAIPYHAVGHYVIIGFSDMTSGIVQQIHKVQPDKYIIVQTTKNAEYVLRRMRVDLSDNQMNQVIIRQGNPVMEQDLRELYIEDAVRIIVLGDEEEELHDANNIECVKHIIAILPEGHLVNGKKLQCDVLLNNQTTFAVLQKIEISDRCNREWNGKIKFRPFNFYESWAQKVLVTDLDIFRDKKNLKISYEPIDRKGISYFSDDTVHIVIIGMSSMGVAMGAETARIAHFPNFIRDNTKKTRITFIDSNARQEKEYFITRYRHLFEVEQFRYIDMTAKEPEWKVVDTYLNKDLEFLNFLDVEFSFVNGSCEMPGVRELISKWAEDKKSYTTIIVCLDSSQKSLAAGLYLPDEVFMNRIPLFIRQKENNCLLSDMISKDRRYSNIRPFGMMNDCFSLDMVEIDRMAQLINFVYNSGEEEYVLDKEKAEEQWENISVVDRWSNIYNAVCVGIKQRSFGISAGIELSDEQVACLAEVEHNRWNVERLMIGFRMTNKDENKSITSVEIKKKYKVSCMAHFDIRPYNALLFEANKYDIKLSKCLPQIIPDWKIPDSEDEDKE